MQRRWMVGIAALVLILGVIACQSPFSAQIGQVYVSRDSQGNFDHDSFLNDTPIYTIVVVRGGDSTETRVEWRYLGPAPDEDEESAEAEETGGESEVSIQSQGDFSAEQTIIGGGRHAFTFEVPDSGRRTAGLYTANVYLNGEYIQTVEFLVVN